MICGRRRWREGRAGQGWAGQTGRARRAWCGVGLPQFSMARRLTKCRAAGLSKDSGDENGGGDDQENQENQVTRRDRDVDRNRDCMTRRQPGDWIEQRGPMTNGAGESRAEPGHGVLRHALQFRAAPSRSEQSKNVLYFRKGAEMDWTELDCTDWTDWTRARAGGCLERSSRGQASARGRIIDAAEHAACSRAGRSLLT